jgi:Ca2+-binding RTX toxin-like protein
LIASFGVIEPRVDAGLTALSEAVDTWLQSRNVSNITDLSVLIDQLTIVDEAVTNAYSQFTTVFENALSRLPDNWGSDIRLDRFIQNGDETFYGTDYSERISGSENNDKIYAGGGNDLIYGQGGHDWIVGGSGNG